MVAQNVSGFSGGEELSSCNSNGIWMCLCLIIPHFSLRHNGLTAIGAIALARALQHNKSLKELK